MQRKIKTVLSVIFRLCCHKPLKADQKAILDFPDVNLTTAPHTNHHPSSPASARPFTLSLLDSINTPAPADLQLTTTTFDCFTNFDPTLTGLSVSNIVTYDAPYIPDVPGNNKFYTDFLRELSLPNLASEQPGARAPEF